MQAKVSSELLPSGSSCWPSLDGDNIRLPSMTIINKEKVFEIERPGKELPPRHVGLIDPARSRFFPESVCRLFA